MDALADDTGMYWRRGFTLIELLVVVAIIALLLVILLPVLSQVRAAGWDARCRSNERQLMAAWQSYLTYHNFQIPGNTRFEAGVPLNPNVPGVMGNELRKHPSEWGSANDDGVMCPTVRRTFPNTWGSVDIGYAVNALWTNSPRTWNSWQNWQKVHHPDQYPWFVDPPVQRGVGSGSGYWSYVPYQLAPFTGPTWGVGFYHAAGHSANVAFGDGHVRAVHPEEMAAAAQTADDLTWFENR